MGEEANQKRRRRWRPGRLVGPVLAKELRESSRRRRLYLLRGGYLGLLTLLAVVVWVMAVERHGQTGAKAIAQMSVAGKALVATIAWGQFLAVQLIAVVVMSTSISEEVERGTLAVLMTTPVSHRQILWGKLLGRSAHLLTLLAVSLPLLAVVRVFGGVPWGYVVEVAAITLTTAMLAGALAMLYSALFRKAHWSILLTLATLFALYVAVPIVLSFVLGILSVFAGGPILLIVAAHTNPLAMMGIATARMWDPSAGFPVLWWAHCLVSLGVMLLLLLICRAAFRRVALRRAFGEGGLRQSVALPPPAPVWRLQSAARAASAPGGQTAPPPRPRLPRTAMPLRRPAPPRRPAPQPKVRSIEGSPLVWRKLRLPMFPTAALRIIALVLFLALAGMAYLLCLLTGAMAFSTSHVVFAEAYLLIAVACTAVFAAVAIAGERETRTLPLLLTTPMSDWHILGALALGVARRTAPIWGLLLGHVLLFSASEIFFPRIAPLRVSAVLMTTLVLIGAFSLLCGAGMFLSARIKRTTPAVVAMLCFVLAVWAAAPWVGGLFSDGPDEPPQIAARTMVDACPFVQIAVTLHGAGRPNLLHWGRWGSWAPSDDDFPDGRTYHWAEGEMGFAGSLKKVGGTALFYVAAGGLLMCCAKARLRRDLF